MRSVRVCVAQKLLRIAELLGLPIGRGKQPAHSFEDAKLVIDNANFTITHKIKYGKQDYLVACRLLWALSLSPPVIPPVMPPPRADKYLFYRRFLAAIRSPTRGMAKCG